MIIHKDSMSVEYRSDAPNSNFGNYDNVFVVDDSSELAAKIHANKPYFNFVLDDSGDLIDIVPDVEKKNEQGLLKNLIPSNDEVEKAEFEIKVLNLIMEVGLV